MAGRIAHCLTILCFATLCLYTVNRSFCGTLKQTNGHFDPKTGFVVQPQNSWKVSLTQAVRCSQVDQRYKDRKVAGDPGVVEALKHPWMNGWWLKQV